ncbi:protein CIP2A homolog [Tubulanus polymorphus]|uniref:protein CIP2A homolog n=1 Tax=Tubulanus polymorphus TaxID=672921 RepID=UPI003DA27ABB
MVNQKRNVHNMDTTVVILLQDQRLMPILSHGLTSDRRDIVQLTLRLLFAGTQIPEFPSLMLGASIVANNQKIDHRANLNESHDRMSPIKKPLSKKNDLPEMFHQRTQHPDSRNTDIDGDIDILIEKMHSGIELDVKNLKLSQVIDIYEVKLQSLQTKESHLTDLLEAKSLALTQSDRLLSQYRNKRAEFDAETRQMRNLLKDTESKNYEYIEKLNELTSVKDKAIATVQAMKTEMYRLQSVSEDYERLMATHEEMQKRFDNAQNQITALQRENNTSKGVQDLLTKHNEQLKEQHNASLKQLEKLDENCKLMNKQLKERDAKLKDMNKKVKSLEDDVSRLKGEKDELDSKIVQLSKEVKQIEQEKKEAKHKISALQSDCTTYEREIKEKQLLLKQQQEKIDKHNQIAALIHNLSSGGPASGGSLNLNITDK